MSIQNGYNFNSDPIFIVILKNLKFLAVPIFLSTIVFRNLLPIFSLYNLFIFSFIMGLIFMLIGILKKSYVSTRIASLIFSTIVYTECIIILDIYWGVTITGGGITVTAIVITLGLIFGGIPIFLLGILASIFNGEWIILGILLFLFVLGVITNNLSIFYKQKVIPEELVNKK